MFVESSLTTEPSSMNHGIKKEEKTPQSSLVLALMENRVENKAVRIFPCFLAPCFAPCFAPFLAPCFTPCFLAPCWLFFRASI